VLKISKVKYKKCPPFSFIFFSIIYGSAKKPDDKKDLSSAHFHLQAKCRQTVALNKLKFSSLPQKNTSLTKLSQSVWENLDLGPACRSAFGLYS